MKVEKYDTCIYSFLFPETLPVTCTGCRPGMCFGSSSQGRWLTVTCRLDHTHQAAYSAGGGTSSPKRRNGQAVFTDEYRYAFFWQLLPLQRSKAALPCHPAQIIAGSQSDALSAAQAAYRESCFFLWRLVCVC